MSESAIRARIKSVLSGVTGIGTVHDYERYSLSPAEWLSLMTSGGQVNGWTIHRQSTSSEALTMGYLERHHQYRIAGVYAMNDAAASEVTLQAILEAVHDAFKSDRTLEGTAQAHDQIQVEAVDTDEVVGRLYHMATLSLLVHERTTR